MSAVPDGIELGRDRDLEGRRNGIWVRRALFGLLVLVVVLALWNVFGQRPTTAGAVSPAATLTVRAPERVRSGLLGGATITVTADRPLRNAVLALDAGWFTGLSVNTIEPAPKKEGSVDGRTTLELGPVAAGSSHVVYLGFQVDPTNVGTYSRSVRLLDGDRELTTVDRTLVVFP